MSPQSDKETRQRIVERSEKLIQESRQRLNSMRVDLLRWPTAARRFQEVIAAAVESFSRQGRTFDYRRSALQQLRERILELPLPEQMEALVVVNNELTEGECVDICFSLRPQLN